MSCLSFRDDVLKTPTVKLIDNTGTHCRVAHHLTRDAADEAGVIKGSKRAVTRYAGRDTSLTLAPNRSGLVTDSPLTTTVHQVTERVITDGCLPRPMCVFRGQITERIIVAGHALRDAERPWALLKLPSVLAGTLVTDCVFSLPVVRKKSACTPVAVFRVPSVLRKSAFTPVGRVSVAGLLLERALTPVTVFCEPVVLWNSALVPLAVL